MTPNPGCTGSCLDSSWMFEDDEASWSTSSDDNSSDDGESGSLIAELPPTNSDEDDGDGDDDEDDSQTPSSELAEKIRGILSHISRAGLTLGSFLHAVSWGNAGCIRDPQIRAARTALMHSPELPVILKNWWMPPHSRASQKSRPQGACSALEEFTVECMHGTLNNELDVLCNQFRTLKTQQSVWVAAPSDEVHSTQGLLEVRQGSQGLGRVGETRESRGVQSLQD